MILITGNKGFIGCNLSMHLGPRDRFTISDYNFDLNNIPFNKVTHVYHMGAISSTTETDVDLLYKANVKFTLDLFNICASKNIPITYASSASVYGNSPIYSVNPLNYYSMTKTIIDYKAEECIKDGANIIGLRFYNVYGKHEDHKGNQASPIHQFTKQALTNKVIKVFEGSENYIRDFVCVDDVIKCILTKKPAGIYDVGTSKPISFMDVAEIISEKYNAKIEMIPFPNHLKGKYQTYTCARKHFDINFISVKEYVSQILF